VTIYIFPNDKFIERKFIGVKKSEPTYLI